MRPQALATILATLALTVGAPESVDAIAPARETSAQILQGPNETGIADTRNQLQTERLSSPDKQERERFTKLSQSIEDNLETDKDLRINAAWSQCGCKTEMTITWEGQYTHFTITGEGRNITVTLNGIGHTYIESEFFTGTIKSNDHTALAKEIAKKMSIQAKTPEPEPDSK